jgi:hypothetical protein
LLCPVVEIKRERTWLPSCKGSERRTMFVHTDVRNENEVRDLVKRPSPALVLWMRSNLWLRRRLGVEDAAEAFAVLKEDQHP